MFPLSPQDLLTAWDLGQFQHPADRALALLSAACPETAPSALAELSVGERDARLLRLRELTFGPRLSGLADCPACDERLELELDVGQLSACGSHLARLFVDEGAHHIEFRLPNSADLAAVRASPDVAAARQRLFERCITNNVSSSGASESLVEAVAGAMAAADPQGDVRLALSCPTCGRQWEELFDIASFFWAEVHAWALRALREVHRLAAAYGWSEADILAMSPWRRQVYLGFVGG